MLLSSQRLFTQLRLYLYLIYSTTTFAFFFLSEDDLEEVSFFFSVDFFGSDFFSTFFGFEVSFLNSDFLGSAFFISFFLFSFLFLYLTTVLHLIFEPNDFYKKWSFDI